MLRHQYDALKHQEEDVTLPKYKDAITVSQQISTSTDKKLYRPEVDTLLHENKRNTTFSHFPMAQNATTSHFFNDYVIIPSLGNLQSKIEHLNTIEKSPEKTTILDGLNLIHELNNESAEMQGSITQFIKG